MNVIINNNNNNDNIQTGGGLYGKKRESLYGIFWFI